MLADKSKHPKPRKCKVCALPYYSQRMASVCSPACAVKYVEARNARKASESAKEDRKQTRARLMEMKPLSYWRDRAQKAFNAWIRARDSGRPCVSCGRIHSGKLNAGHYLSRGARPELAFEPMNCHLQCEPCNTSLSGNIALYRAELIRRIGIEGVEWLEGHHEPKRYRREDYQAIEAEYRAKLR